MASLAGKLNSIATIYTLDIHMKYFHKKNELTGDKSESSMVWIGKLAAFASIAIAVIFEWKDLLGISGEGGFTFIQKYTGFISPGVFAMFILGMFWKRTTGTAAVAGLLTGFLLAIFFLAIASTAALQWLFDNADALGVDPTRIGVAGEDRRRLEGPGGGPRGRAAAARRTGEGP
mgnify:CR=1 FL=1